MSEFSPGVVAVVCSGCHHPALFQWDPAHVWADGSVGPDRKAVPCEVCRLRAEVKAQGLILARVQELPGEWREEGDEDDAHAIERATWRTCARDLDAAIAAALETT